MFHPCFFLWISLLTSCLADPFSSSIFSAVLSWITASPPPSFLTRFSFMKNTQNLLKKLFQKIFLVNVYFWKKINFGFKKSSFTCQKRANESQNNKISLVVLTRISTFIWSSHARRVPRLMSLAFGDGIRDAPKITRGCKNPQLIDSKPWWQ